MVGIVVSAALQSLFSSPEPKAHKVSLWYSSRAGVRASTFSNFNILDNKANHDQILSKASLRRGEGCVRFMPGRIRTWQQIAPIDLQCE